MGGRQQPEAGDGEARQELALSQSHCPRSLSLVSTGRIVFVPSWIFMAITLSPETAARLLASIKRYAAEHLEQDFGDLQARLLLDYCLQEVGPVVYNQAIADAQRYFQGRVADLDGVCYEHEFAYWPPPGATKKRKEVK